MGFDFLTDLSNMQVEIPPEVSRLAGFFVLLQGGMIYLQKKNNPAKDIWEDLSWVFLGGLFVYLFPELIRFMETLVNALMPIELHADSAIAEFMKESNLGDGSVPPVSYTHLDVYKRQDKLMVPSLCRGLWSVRISLSLSLPCC